MEAIKVRKKADIMIPLSAEMYNKLRVLQREIKASDIEEVIDYLISKSLFCKERRRSIWG